MFDLLHVPYRGGAQAVIDLTAGRVDVMFGNLPEFLGQVRSGGLHPLAFGGARVSPLLPELPLIARDVPGFEVSNWFGIAGPRGMSPSGRWLDPGAATRACGGLPSSSAWPKAAWNRY